MSMTSNRPYLLRALHEWILDNGMTPYVVIDADMPNVNVPERYVEDGKIVLNLSKTAALNMKIENEVMRFTTSFSGVSCIVSAPVTAVLAIYSKENGRGMIFPDDEDELDDDEGGDDGGGDDEPPTPPKVKGKPKLTVVK